MAANAAAAVKAAVTAAVAATVTLDRGLVVGWRALGMTSGAAGWGSCRPFSILRL